MLGQLRSFAAEMDARTLKTKVWTRFNMDRLKITFVSEVGDKPWSSAVTIDPEPRSKYFELNGSEAFECSTSMLT